MSRCPVTLLALLSLMIVCPVNPLLGDETVTITVKTTTEAANEEVTAAATDKKAPFTGTRPAVDVAILLDTSNSMDGLINQAKSQLWKIVQQFQSAQKQGQTPSLRVSVFEYGNSRLPASEGYIRQVVQLTDDLDKVSEALFALTTKGGDEYCGLVISEAIQRLDWSSEPNSYKAIFIAGNEPFTQGPHDPKEACQEAIGAGIVVNTIHCGDYNQGVSGMWNTGEQIAEGKFLNINQDREVVHIKCPQDEIIIKLNAELNKTYLWYGTAELRNMRCQNQAKQDWNSRGYGEGGLASRAITKASKMYCNVGRDLVDTCEEASKSGKSITECLQSCKVDDLPEAMQKMTTEEREAHVQEMMKKRGELKEKIAQLSKERSKFETAERERMAEESDEDGETLGDAIASAIQQQLSKSGFTVEN